MSERELVVLAVVTRPHGVRGELRVHLHNPDSTVLYDRDTVLLRHRGEVREVEVVESRRGPKGAMLLSLAGVEGREAADALRGAELCVPRRDLPPAGEGEWYVIDLVGLEARDGAGRTLGEVVDVIPYPTIDCLRVRGEGGVREVPLNDDFVPEVDVRGGFVVLAGFDELPIERGR